jgi:hypothetical protein
MFATWHPPMKRKIAPSNTLMRFRKLRITWSVGCGLACVLLIALWVRSYRWYDIGGYYSTVGSLSLESQHGKVKVYTAIGHARGGGFVGGTVYDKDNRNGPRLERWGFGHSLLRPFDIYMAMPHWLPVLLLAASAIVPWIRRIKWRFSLLTLLIATTLVAAVLGLIVAVFRWPGG